MNDSKSDAAETISTETSTGLTKLQVAQGIRDYHHSALWEEEKHFTWFISIILSAALILITNDKVSLPLKVLLVFLVSLIGGIISLIALRVVRNESQNFQNSLIRLNDCLNRCFDDFKVPAPPERANKTYYGLVLAVLRGQCSIRDAFQFIFVVFAAAFVIIMLGDVYVAWTRSAFPH
jgi:hypothetical protein